jgi:hypothetical protein
MAKHYNTIHGLSHTRFKQIWSDMNRRCYDKNSKDYYNYGDRGIVVCEQWNKSNPEGFVNFIKDMYDTYEENMTLDRIDSNGNYELANCRWIDGKFQSRNRKNYNKLNEQAAIDIRLKFATNKYKISELAKEYGCSWTTIKYVVQNKTWIL